jgi:outer membrane receptor protein involved in Fe transport
MIGPTKTPMSSRWRASLALALLAVFPSRALGQATGAITGLITDSSGALVPRAAIVAVSESTSLERHTVSAGDGFFTIPLLPPGTYQVRAGLSGFSTAFRDGIQVLVNETARVDLVLQVGAVTDSVTVAATELLVETRSATLGIVVGERTIVDLPLNGRNFTQLGTLMPGVVAPPAGLGGQTGNATPTGGVGNATGGFNVNGMRNQSNNFLLDGASNNDTFNSGFVLRPPPDAIQEFKILTHAYDAAYGRNVGSVVNVVTKSGSNDWQGTLWAFNRNDRFQARNFFAAAKPRLEQNQFGAAAGGPLRRNRLFLFAYVEGFRNLEGQTDVRAVPTVQQRAGDFSARAALRDPLTGGPFPGNVIPADRLDPLARQWLDRLVPLPNDGSRLVRAPNIDDAREQFGVRFDYRPNAQHLLLGRYIFGHTRASNPIGASNFAPVDNLAVATVQDAMGSDTWVLRDNVINVVRVAVNRFGGTPNVSSGLDPRDFGFAFTGSTPASLGLPFVTIPGFFTTGDAQSQFTRRINTVVGLTDDLTWVRGEHTIKLGGEVRRDRIDTTFIFDPNGEYLFSGIYSGDALADFLLGHPALFRQAGGDPELAGSSWTYAVFGQNEHRVSPRLTLNYGLRYEVTTPFTESRDRLMAIHPGRQSTLFPQAPTGLVYPGDVGVPDGTYATDVNNLSPRVAAVWDPLGDGRTSLRAAWGLFYDTLPGQGDFFQNVVAAPFQSITEVTFPLQVTRAAFADPLRGISGGGGFPPGLIAVGWGPEFSTPVAQHFHVTVQRQVGDGWGLEAGYVGSRARNLPLYLEINPTTPILSPAPAIGPRPMPGLGLVRPTFTVARSWYDSLQASARLRPWHGLGFLASYALGHARDHASALNISTSEARPMLPVVIGDQTTFDAALAREQGDALFDVRHRVVVSFGYDIPVRDAWTGPARWALSDWQISGIVQAQTGFPFTVVEPNNVSLTSLPNRPNMTCDPNRGGARTPAQWFNTACFERLTLPANAGQVGNEPRNAVRGPGFSRVDLALVKAVRVGARHRLQLRVEAFNAFNTVRFNQPGNQIGSPTFGQITSADDGRIIQLGIKYTF